jgi:hypothetical protein
MGHTYHSKTITHFYTQTSPSRKYSNWNEKSQKQKLITAGSKLRENAGEVDDFQKNKINFSVTINSEEQSPS